MSLDGYATGPAQDLEHPLGVGGEYLHKVGLRDPHRPGHDRRGRRLRRDRRRVHALSRAFLAAGGRDVRLGGGVATIKEYVRAGLLDELHVAQVPVLLGAGERPFDGDAFAGYEVVEFDAFAGYEVVEFVPSTTVAHYRLQRRS